MDSYNGFDNETEEKDTFNDSHLRFIRKIIKKIFKYLAILIMVSVYGIIFARMIFAKVPSDFKKVAWTDNMNAVYQADPENFELWNQTVAESYDDNGFYQISDIIYNKTAGEIQFVIRYNNRNTINVLMENYRLSERPTGEVFVYILRDNDGNVYKSYDFSAKSRPMNEFRKLVFSGIDFDTIRSLYLDIYYIGDVSEDAPMNVTFTAYSSTRTAFPVKHGTPSGMKYKLSDNPAYISNLD